MKCVILFLLIFLNLELQAKPKRSPTQATFIPSLVCGTIEAQGKILVDNIGQLVLVLNQGTRNSLEFRLLKVSAEDAYQFNGTPARLQATIKSLYKDSLPELWVTEIKHPDLDSRDFIQQRKIAKCDDLAK